MRALIAVTMMLLVGCSGSPAPADEAPPGSPAVFERIEGLEDCAALQEEFDAASATSDRAEAGTPEAEAALAYMEAADERLREVGCY